MKENRLSLLGADNSYSRIEAKMKRFVLFCLAAGIGVAGGCARFHAKPLSPQESAANFERRSLHDAGLCGFLQTNLHRTVTQWGFEELALAALYFHPDLEVARAQWGVAKAAQIKAGERPNPSVGISPGYNTTTSVPSPWLFNLNFDLPIETAGKRGYRLAHAQHLSEAARLNLASVAWQVRSRVRNRWLELFAATQKEHWLRRQQAAQEQVVQLLEGQLAAGAISPFELTQARVALRGTALSLTDAQRQQAEARAALADAVGVPVKALESVKISFTALEHLPPSFDPANARREALMRRADILAALAEYAASQSALQLEIAKQYPDVHLGPGYEYDQGDNKWSIGLSLELPLLNQNQGGIAEARAKREEAAAKFLALQARVIGEIDRAVAGYEAARRTVATAEQLCAEQERLRATAQRRFAAGEIGRLELATTDLEMFTAQMARWDAVVKAHQAFGALEDALQSKPLPQKSTP